MENLIPFLTSHSTLVLGGFVLAVIALVTLTSGD